MVGFVDIQITLDRILGDNSAGNHKAFWRGKTRAEFIVHSVFGFVVVKVGDPDNSNLVHALRGRAPFGRDLTPPTPGAFMPRMPAFLDTAEEGDIALIEAWIADGCPETANDGGLALADQAATDDDHVRHWREVDIFFLPGSSSEETSNHVNRWHASVLGTYLEGVVNNPGGTVWSDFISSSGAQQSFEYIRLHQRRLTHDSYNSEPENVFDSFWKFGGDLLPPDPASIAHPEHRMDSVGSWFLWAPHLHMTLTSSGINNADLALARGWQIGLVADGLVRTDRPSQMPIPEFDKTAPDLKHQVIAHYAAMSAADLIDATIVRANAWFT